jgi:hypothetical protein
VLILQRPWTEQPQEVAQLDDANPLTAGIIDAILPASGRSVKGITGALDTASATNTVYTPGFGRKFTTGNNRDTYSIPAAQTAGPVSMLALYRLTGTPAGSVRVVGNTSTTAQGFGLAPNGTSFRAIFSNGSATFLTGGSVSVALKCDVLTNDGTNGNYYENGRLVAGPTAAAITASSKPLTLGDENSATGNAAACEIYLVVVWNRVLQAREVLELYANPWQLFAPRRIYVPYAAAAGNWPNILSAPTYVPGSLTSSGFRPRVTATY